MTEPSRRHTTNIWQRRSRFDEWTRRQASDVPELRNACTCPCCGYPTLRNRRHDEICYLCDWQDDGQDDSEADTVWGGPNYYLSLEEARANFEDHLFAQDPKRDHRPILIQALSSRDVMDAKRQIIAAFELLLEDPRPQLTEAWKQIGRMREGIRTTIYARFNAARKRE